MPNRDPHSQLPLTPVVLHILLSLAEGARHGYAIAGEIEETTEGQIRMGPGTLYGSIQRMLSSFLIEETPAPRGTTDDDARRRSYRMTPVGRCVLELSLDRLSRIVRSSRAKRVLRDPGLA